MGVKGVLKLVKIEAKIKIKQPQRRKEVNPNGNEARAARQTGKLSS